MGPELPGLRRRTLCQPATHPLGQLGQRRARRGRRHDRPVRQDRRPKTLPPADPGDPAAGKGREESQPHGRKMRLPRRHRNPTFSP